MYSNEKELNNCTFVKTVLMLFVVFYHCCLWWCDSSWFVRQPTYKIDSIDVICRWINSFHIYAFALTSGYIYYYSRNELGKYKKYLSLLKNKFGRLIVPYVFASVGWGIPASIYFFNYNIEDIIVKYGLGTAPGQLWFLLMLFVVFACVYPLNELINNHVSFGIIFSVCTYFLGVLGGANALNYFQIWTGLKYISFFILGFYLRKFYSSINNKLQIAVYSVVLHLVLLVVETKMGASSSLYIHILKICINYLSHIAGAVAAFYILQFVSSRVSESILKQLNNYGSKTMVIYLIHQQIIFCFLNLLDGRIPAILHIVISYIGTLVVSLLLATVLLQFSLTRKLVGSI